MLWLKNLVKRKNSVTTEITTGNLNKMFMDDMNVMGGLMKRRLEVIKKLADQQPRTSNPKGKNGVWEYVPTFHRTFKDDNKKWLWKKFGPKTFHDANGFIKALERRGFKRIGSGAFSTVLAKDGQERVIKVIRRADGWIDYAHWAAQIGEAGHFAPKVFSYKVIKGKKKDFAVAIVERLETTLEDAPKEHALQILPNILWRAEDNPMAAKFTEELAPGLLGFLKKMGGEWKIPIMGFDLHDGNLMLRKDGQFVVVDPVSRPREKVLLRLRAGDFSPAVAAASRFWKRKEDRYLLSIHSILYYRYSTIYLH